MSAAVGLRDNFVADDIEHRACGEGEAPGQKRFSYRSDRGPDQPADGFDEPGQCRNSPESNFSVALAQKRDSNGKALRKVLQADAEGKRHAAGQPMRPEGDAGLPVEFFCAKTSYSRRKTPDLSLKPESGRASPHMVGQHQQIRQEQSHYEAL